jgi:hypothetical protein
MKEAPIRLKQGEDRFREQICRVEKDYFTLKETKVKIRRNQKIRKFKPTEIRSSVKLNRNQLGK